MILDKAELEHPLHFQVLLYFRLLVEVSIHFKFDHRTPSWVCTILGGRATTLGVPVVQLLDHHIRGCDSIIAVEVLALDDFDIEHTYDALLCKPSSARSNEPRRSKRRDSADHMNRATAGKIMKPHFRQPAVGVPAPMADNGLIYAGHEHAVNKVWLEVHALGDCP